MSIDMSSNFFKLLMHFRRHDLVNFTTRHGELFEEAKERGNHLAVTSHYYSVMSGVIDQYFNGNFHFASPTNKKQKLEETLHELHVRIGELLGLRENVKCLDIGCGIGGIIKDLAPTGADLTGITVARNEVEMGNDMLYQMGVSSRCRLVEGDCHAMSLPAAGMDAAYAVYSLKYFPQIEPVMAEVARVLKKGGKFVIYDLLKTDKYDENNEEHRKIVEGLEYACGMPSLHTRRQMIDACEKAGMSLVYEEDLTDTNGLPFYYSFSHSALFMWLLRSSMVNTLIKIGQAVRILPKGFHQFNKIFLSGTVKKIVDGGQLGILSGSQIFVFQKN